ncbi:MAG: hypothetical protein MI807_07455 [Verrucomicrobiales bacterium]|nr:hypothetical protein [Verrucomicrobiales bacterium]
MSPDVMDRIFEPFFITGDISTVVGMRLSSSLSIVKRHGHHPEAMREEVEAAEVKHFRMKPIDSASLLATIRSAVEQPNNQVVISNGK